MNGFKAWVDDFKDWDVLSFLLLSFILFESSTITYGHIHFLKSLNNYVKPL